MAIRLVIGIDCGHGLPNYPNSGAIGLINESKETRVLGTMVIDLLKSQGHTIVDCTVDKPTSNADSINQRVKKINAQKLDLFVSLHFNSGGGHGTEVLTYNGKFMKEAERVLLNLEGIGFRNRGIKNGTTPKKIAVINSTKWPAILIETCFVDSQEDVKLYNDNKAKIASLIVEGITGKVTTTVDKKDDENMIPKTLLIAANQNSILKDNMINNIKALQGVYNLNKDGIAKEELVKLLPELITSSQRGVVTILQKILIDKGFLSKGSDTGVIGPSCENAINRFKREVGIPVGGVLFDSVAWRKVLEY